MPQPHLPFSSQSSTLVLFLHHTFVAPISSLEGPKALKNPVLQMEMSHYKSALNNLLISFL